MPQKKSKSRRRSGIPRRESLDAYQQNCANTLLPHFSDREWRISHVDHLIQLEFELQLFNTGMRALQTIVDQATSGKDQVPFVSAMRIVGHWKRDGVFLNSTVDKSRSFSETTLRDEIKKGRTCIVKMSFMQMILNSEGVEESKEVPHAIVCVFSGDECLLIDNNERDTVEEETLQMLSWQFRRVKAFTMVPTPQINIDPNEYYHELISVGMYRPMHYETMDGLCAMLSYILIFDMLCTGDLFRSKGHYQRLVTDMGNDPVGTLLYVRAFESSLFRLMLHGYPRDRPPKWWHWGDGYNFIDFRKFGDDVVMRAGNGYAVREDSKDPDYVPVTPPPDWTPPPRPASDPEDPGDVPFVTIRPRHRLPPPSPPPPPPPPPPPLPPSPPSQFITVRRR